MQKIKWSVLFKTHIPLVDEEHQQLFAMINDIAETLEQGAIDEQKVELALDGLVDYASQHFVDEEKIMVENQVDRRHQRLQRMEHSSFIYDLNKLRNYAYNTNPEEEYEKLLEFCASWLVYHTLRTDQKLAMQVHAIEEGTSPEDAYEYAESHALNPALSSQIIDAVIRLWTDSLERIHLLEEQLDPKNPVV